MANKNIQMKEFNGTSYDNLYPKTLGSNVSGTVANATNASKATNANYATSAGSADRATNATNATNADNSKKLEGKTVAEIVSQAVASGAKIQTGSYIGTGTYGPDNPNSLTFDKKPVFVVLVGTKPIQSFGRYNANIWGKMGNPDINSIMISTLIGENYQEQAGFGSYDRSGLYGKIVGNDYYWYNTADSSSQENAKGTMYQYLAFFTA